MIKTLRITSFLAVLLACGILAASFVFQKRSDPKAEELLKAESTVEKFSKNQDIRAAKKDTQLSPLVKQAQAFANFLNPPRQEPSPEERHDEPEIRPEVVTSKFTLIGTSFNTARPEASMALIDEPGKGTYWVKQAAQVGHLTIEQIKSGIVVVNDNGRTSEIVAERPEKISLLRIPPPEGAPPGTAPAITDDSPPPPPPSVVEDQMEQIAKELAEIEKQVAAGTLDPNEAAEKTAAIVDRHMAETEAAHSRINIEESKSIDRLGAQLKTKQQGGANDVKQTSKKEQVVPKTETKEPAKPKPAPRPRDPRRRGTRPRRGAPRQIQDANNPTTP